MKKQRVFYLMGVVAAVTLVFYALFFELSQDGSVLNGETAVSLDTSVDAKQMILNDVWLETVSDQLEAAEYVISQGGQFKGQQIAYQAPNRGQNLRTYFSETSIQIEPRLVQEDAWHGGLEIVGLANGVQTIVPELDAHIIDDNRVTMDYGQWQAWYVNDVRGVEQGFTIEKPLFTHETGVLQIDMAVTGNLTPQFVSDDEVSLVTAVGEQVLTYQNLVAFDAQGTELAADMEVIDVADGQPGIRLAVVVAEADYPIVVDPLIEGGIDWVGWIDQPDSNFGFAVSTAGDVNNDGFDDVLVGAHWFDGSAPNTGAVFGYYGGPGGLLPTYQWIVTGDTPDMELGYDVNTAGDVNNDGFDDVIVGTNMTDTVKGKAFVYPGTLTGLSNQAIWVGEGEQAGDGFGTAVNTAGDVNGDNFDDIIIGAPNYDINGHSSPDGGRAYVFSGQDVTNGQNNPALAWRAENDAFLDAPVAFGFSVGTAGDVDDNGYDDVIIGAPYYDPDGETGYAGIFGGSSSGLPGGWGNPVVQEASGADWYVENWSSYGAHFGFSVATAGDVNGDGFSDVVIGAPQFDDNGTIPAMGAVYVFTGTNPISAIVGDTYSAWRVTLDIEDAMLGYDVGTAGDVDLDGYDDIIIGAPQFDNDAIAPQQVTAVNGGGAFVYRGSPTGLGDSWELSSNVANAKLGTSVGTAGDVNGDGYADVIIGAPEMPNASSVLGEAYSFYGSGQIVNLQAYNDSPTTVGNITALWAEIDAGGVLGYQWDLGDGSVVNGKDVTHVYSEPGYFTAVVTGTSFTDEITATTAVTISESSLIDPTNGGSVEFLNEDTGFGTKMEVPPGAVSNTLKISYTPLTTITQPSPENSLGYYFDMDEDLPDNQLFLPIITTSNGGGLNNVAETAVVDLLSELSASNSYFFAKPVTVTIVYNDEGLTLKQEENLKLLYWNVSQQDWVDIAEECGLENTYVYYPDDNYYTVQICHLSRMAVAH